jgi:hypothetical protein
VSFKLSFEHIIMDYSASFVAVIVRFACSPYRHVTVQL